MRNTAFSKPFGFDMNDGSAVILLNQHYPSLL